MLLVYLLNYAAAQLGFKPYAYCWGRNLAPLVEGYWQIVVLAVLCYFVWLVIRRGVLWAIPGSFLVLLVFGAGTFLTTIFGLGVEARCG